MQRTDIPAPDEAEKLALTALAFLAGDGQRLTRFLQLTGIAPDRLLTDAGQTATLVAVLEHLASDESLLLVFASSANIDPAEILPALELLRGDGDGRGRW